jgi:hypothetical protein
MIKQIVTLKRVRRIDISVTRALFAVVYPDQLCAQEKEAERREGEERDALAILGDLARV